MKTAREKVYAAIDTEREYQELRWNPATTTSGGLHEVAAFVLFMEEYIQEARVKISRNADPVATIEALHSVRKVTALGVACMEQHGALTRFIPATLK